MKRKLSISEFSLFQHTRTPKMMQNANLEFFPISTCSWDI